MTVESSLTYSRTAVSFRFIGYGIGYEQLDRTYDSANGCDAYRQMLEDGEFILVTRVQALNKKGSLINSNRNKDMLLALCLKETTNPFWKRIYK